MNPNKAVGDQTIRVHARGKLIQPAPLASIGAPRLKIEHAEDKPKAKKNVPAPPAAALLLFCFLFSALCSTAALITPPFSGDTGGYYPTRLLWNLAASTSTNRIYYTNASLAFGDTNAFHVATNGSGIWQWRSGATVLATNTANKQFGIWRTNGTGAAVYGYTRYEPTQDRIVRVNALGELVDPTNFLTANNLGVGSTTFNLSASTNLDFTGLSATARTAVTNAANSAITARGVLTNNFVGANLFGGTNYNRREIFRYGALNNDQPYVPRPWTNDVMGPHYADTLGSYMPTPPVMWSTWYAYPQFQLLASHYLITNAIHMILTNGDPCRIVEISDSWTAPNRTNGLMVHNWTNFPGGPDALTNTVNYAHAMGFQIRIYTSYNTSGRTCGQYVGSTPDTIESDIQQFANWGFDGITADGCESFRYFDNDYATQYHRHVYSALMRAGRPMTVHSANPGIAANGLSLPEAFAMNNILSSVNTNRPGADKWAAEFVTGTLSNIWDQAYQWWTGPYYDHHAKMARPGHYWYCPTFLMDGSTDTETGLQVLRNQLTPLAMFAMPVIYGAIANTLYRSKVFTNALWSAVHQDPACKWPVLVSSNGLIQVWKKPLNGTNFGAVAVMMNNMRHVGEAAEPITLSMADIGLDPTRDVVASDIWRYTNVVVAGGSRTFTIPPNTASFWIFKHRFIPDGSVGDEQAISFQNISLFGTGQTKNDMTTYGPTPWLNNDGMTQSAANQIARMSWSPPSKARSAQVRYQVYSAATADVAWTNYLALYYSGTTGRVVLDPANFAGTTNSTVIAPNGALAWHTNYMTWTPTNSAAFLGLIWNASSNASARYITSPLYVRYGY